MAHSRAIRTARGMVEGLPEGSRYHGLASQVVAAQLAEALRDEQT